MRKKREEFRKSLADLISTDRREEMSTELLSEDDKQLLRCHYYMKYGIDSKNVAPMDFEWLKNICKKVKPTPRVNKEKLIDMFRDIEVNNILILKFLNNSSIYLCITNNP